MSRPGEGMRLSRATAFEMLRDRVQERALEAAQKSRRPEVFLETFSAGISALKESEHFYKAPLSLEGARHAQGHIRVAAEIHALAAARSLAAFWHAIGCTCDACRVNR